MKNRTEENDHVLDIWICVSDLMTSLIFIFLIIIGVFSLQYRTEQASLLSAKEELQRPSLERIHLLEALRDDLLAQGLKVEVFPEEGILRLEENALHFEPARAYPEESTLMNLGLLAQAMTRHLPCYSSSRFTAPIGQTRPEWCGPVNMSSAPVCPANISSRVETVMIEGHTDATAVRPTAGYKDNLALSAARATTVLRLLTLCDSRLGELYNTNGQPLIGVSGYSSLRPVVVANPDDARNRRIDVRVMMELPAIALRRDTGKGAPQ